MIAPAYGNHDQQNYFARNHKPQGLPSPVELAQRVEEAKTSAKLLSQVVQSTPPTEVLGNELIREFVERCQSASRSMQHYIHADNPPPDEDTLLTLIETNDQLATAMSRHQRALLQARRVTGVSPPPPTNGQSGPFQTPAIPPSNSVQQVAPPPGPPPRKQVPQPGNQDPFGDENETKSDVHGSTAPPSHGLPPPGIWSQKQSPSSLPGSGYEASPNNMGRQDPPTNDTTRHKVDADEEQEVNRQPVKYRF